jgi:sporulation protein YlmC with PRC-barrel domain
MLRKAVLILSGLAILAPALALAANEVVAIDAKVLMNAKVERNGKHVGTVQRVMVNPATGRIEHVDILMTEGQQRVIAVPWSGVKLFQDTGGNMTVSLTSRAAGEASPSASPSTSVPIVAPANDVLAAQQRLKDRGYYAGPADGVMGPNTEAALRAFQRDRSLTVTGRLDPETARTLANEHGGHAHPSERGADTGHSHCAASATGSRILLRSDRRCDGPCHGRRAAGLPA